MQHYEEMYRNNYENYQKATTCLISLIGSIIKNTNITVHAVTGRTKTIQSYLDKSKSYSDPENEIQDYIGIRIITYVNSDVDLVCQLIEKEFKIDKKNSSNKKEKLGIDKLGYLSIHYIASCKANRLSLPEYSYMKNMCFEIQVRTLLQHTWAEIEHDRNYKFSGVLPSEIKRRFNLMSGVLEFVDNEFNSIAFEIDKYKKNVQNDISLNSFDIEINTTSITEFIGKKYPYLVEDTINDTSTWNKNWKYIVEELNEFGLFSINDLLEVMNSSNFIEKPISNHIKTVFGYLRELMIITDSNKYFQKCWNGHWTATTKSSVEKWQEYDSQIEEKLKLCKIKINENKTSI